MKSRKSYSESLVQLFLRLALGVRLVLVIIAYIGTNPWHCMSVAIQNILAVQEEDERRILLRRWVENKKREYEYVGFAAAIVASSVTGSIQWPALAGARWLIFACFYGSLLLSLVSVVIAFHLSILMATYDTHSSGRNSLFEVLNKTNGGQWWHMNIVLFAFQAPIMLLSYAVVSYLLGLTLLVFIPISGAGGLNDSKKIAITFIGYIIFASLIYITVSVSTNGMFLRAMDKGCHRGNAAVDEQSRR